MNNYNFTFNDKELIEFGCMLCYFDKLGNVEISDYPAITFNTVQNNSNDSFDLTYATYDKALEGKLSFCKIDCNNTNAYFTRDEIREIYNWLDIRGYGRLVLPGEYFEDTFFEGGFTSIQPVKNNKKVVGFELTFISRYPYALSDDLLYAFDLTDEKLSGEILNNSDDAKPVYPTLLEIIPKSDGNLTIENSLDKEVLEVKNCVTNEVIKIDCEHRIIETDSSHDVCNDFNYNYLKLLKGGCNNVNMLTFSIPCKVRIVLNEVRKVGFL